VSDDLTLPSKWGCDIKDVAKVKEAYVEVPLLENIPPLKTSLRRSLHPNLSKGYATSFFPWWLKHAC